MPCLPTYLSGGNPCAGFRALLKSSRRQQQKQHLSLKPNALRLVEAPAAGLPLPALASRRSPSPPSPRSLFTDVSTEPPSKVGSGFRPARVVVVAKTTRYEFEQQRYRFAGLSEEDLKQLLALKGSNYSGLLERHRIHTKNVEHVVDSLRNEKIEVRLVKRREYDEETVRWADAIIAAGGDGTMLLAASKVLDRLKPVIGVNTDPDRSEGHLCLPVRYTHSFPDALQKLYRGEFRWQWRQRTRLYLEGTGINPIPVDLHDQQLSQEQHSRAHVNERLQDQRSQVSEPHLLPVRSLNEVFIGESLSSRASYYEISIDDGPWEKQKSSGLNICTGTGSKAWSFNINKVANQAVEEILKIGKLAIAYLLISKCHRVDQKKVLTYCAEVKKANSMLGIIKEEIENKTADTAKSYESISLPLSKELIQKVTNGYNESLLYNPEEPKMFFSIREPISNRVFSSSRQRGFASKICIRSRCWDACMVVDGGTSFEFNDGAIASVLINTEDALRTVLLEE